VLPLRLFGNRTFALTGAIGFVVGFAMFGAVTFLPLYLQVVQGVSPTGSGLRLLPMMAGMLLMSTLSGQLISRWGRYKVFPLVGTPVMAIGLVLLGRLDAQSSLLQISLAMLVLGLGLGMVMQVLVIAVQNAVDYADLGVATSGTTYFRSIGSAFGVALFGAIFANRLQTNLQRFLATTSSAGVDPSAVQANPAALQQLPPALHGEVVQAYVASLQPVFLAAVPFALLAFLLTWFLREVPLRQTTRVTDPAETFALPAQRTSLEEIERALVVLVGRENRQRVYERLASRAGLTLAPACCWMLLRLAEHAPVSLDDLTTRLRVPLDLMRSRLDQLRLSGLVDAAPAGAGELTGRIVLTDIGHQTAARLVAARREGLAELLADWQPEHHAELAELLNRLARSLVDDEPDAETLVRGSVPAA
jgi:MFS family permease